MSILKTAEGIVIDGLSRAGNAHPGDIFLVSVEQQGNHSLCRNIAGFVGGFYQISALYQN
jgi:hypothetical protein